MVMGGRRAADAIEDSVPAVDSGGCRMSYAHTVKDCSQRAGSLDEHLQPMAAKRSAPAEPVM